MTLKCEKIEHVFKPMELMFEGGRGEGGLHCLWGYFRKQLGKEDV